jgi:hypothetical protein
VWAAISEYGIYFVVLYYYIYSVYLGSWYYPKGFLIWPLVGTEKVGMRSAGLSGYSAGSHLFIFRFDTFTRCGPLTLGWYSVCSHLFSICKFTGSYLLFTIWQLKTYYIHLLLFYKINYQIQQTRVRAL